MRKLALFLASALIATTGCVISPRRTVNGTGSGGSNSEFNLSANPTSQAIVAGSSAAYTISISPVNGFTGTVSLNASASTTNVSASFDNTTITGGSGSATLTVATTTATPSSSATITVTASDTANNISQNVSVTAAIQGAATPAGSMTASESVVSQSGCVSSPAGSNTLSSLINYSPAGIIQVRNGDSFVSSGVSYSAGETLQFRLVENLPATTYSLFVMPQGGVEIPLATDLQVPADQRGATTLGGWGQIVNAPEGATLAVCRFSLQ
jgi:hypothetical protein